MSGQCAVSHFRRATLMAPVGGEVGEIPLSKRTLRSGCFARADSLESSLP